MVVMVQAKCNVALCVTNDTDIMVYLLSFNPIICW